MSWNYRVVLENDTYTLREVYYDIPETDGMMWTENPAYPMGETLDELRQDIDLMKAGLLSPVLTEVNGKLVEV